MKWELSDPKLGDIVRVKIGDIYHFGIFVDEEQIIQFGLPPSVRKEIKDQDIEVCSSNIDVFLQGGFLERGIKEPKDGKKRSNKKIVEYAKSMLGQKGYNIIHNNCEHFAYQCAFGYKKSTQTDYIRQFFMNMPIVDVYSAIIPNSVKIKKIYPRAKDDEIKNAGSEIVKREKFCAWKLLEYGFLRTFGIKIKDLEFNKTEYGKWQCEGYHFSISHSHGIVAVALSKKPVGIDIEKFEPPKKDIAERIFSDSEIKEYFSIKEKWQHLITAWSKKESIYKMQGQGYFIPQKIQISDNSVTANNFIFLEQEYVLSVCSEDIKNIRYHHDIDLKNV